MSPYTAFQIALLTGFLTPEHKDVLVTSYAYSYRYAREVIGGRWEPGEAIIATSAEYSYCYAGDVVRGRWEPGEAIIATSAEYSYFYAKYVIRGRWEPGEAVISSYRYYCKHYIQSLLELDTKYKTDPDFMAFILAHG